jgi:hypothetical protein
LFYLSPQNALMRLPIMPAGRISAGRPEVLLAHVRVLEALGRTFDVSPDGRRFLFVRDRHFRPTHDIGRVELDLRGSPKLPGRSAH